MAKLLEAAGQAAPEVKYILELNPEHQLVQKMADEADEVLFGRWVEILLGQAMLAERGSMEDPAQFLTAVNQLLTKVE
jgi:molecular chaperone HtpG